MSERTYTLAMWKVKPGRESEFVAAWRALGDTFRQLPQPPTGNGVLIQSLTDPAVYYSFGPWASVDDITAMRENEAAQASLRQVMDLCTEATPGGYRLVAES